MDKNEFHYISSSTSLFCESNQSFFKNGERITKLDPNIDDKNTEKVIDISLSEFKTHVNIEVSDFINRSFDNIIVLAGAGASVVSLNDKIDANYGKTVFMLANIIHTTLRNDSEVYSLNELADISKYKEAIEIDSENERKLNPSFNLEDFLSNIITFEKYIDESNVKYINSKEKIFSIIKENTNYDYDIEKLHHAKLIKTLSSKVKSPSILTIVTTNYDTLFEDAAERIGFTVIDGFSYSHKPYFNIDMFEWYLVRDIENVKTKEQEYKRNIVNLLKIHGSLTWERNDSGIHRIDKDKVKNPLMIFPSSNKYMQSYQDPYFELLTKFQDYLKRPNTLLITTGFSFTDTHISKMITQAIKHNKGLSTLISDYNIKQENQNWKDISILMNQNYQIAFLKTTMNSDLADYLGVQHDSR